MLLKAVGKKVEGLFDQARQNRMFSEYFLMKEEGQLWRSGSQINLDCASSLPFSPAFLGEKCMLTHVCVCKLKEKSLEVPPFFLLHCFCLIK